MRSTIMSSMIAALLVLSGCGSSNNSGGGGDALGGGGSGPANSGGGGNAGTGGQTSKGTGGAGTGGANDSGGGGSATMSDCELYCQKLQTAGCAGATCLSDCQKGAPECTAQSTAAVHCAVTKGTIGCDGQIVDVEGCDATEKALNDCTQEACYAGQGACDPRLKTSCPSGKGCYWEPNDNYQFVCETPGSHQLGDACAYGDPCVASLYCDDGQAGHCRQWCCQDTDCGSGQTCQFVAAGGSVNVRVCM
jgi:hypothetical protein